MDKIFISFPKNAEERGYPIFIGTQILERLSSVLECARYSKIFFVTEPSLRAIFEPRLDRVLGERGTWIEIPLTENRKNLEATGEVWTALLNGGADRRSLVLNIGGGVIGDLGGFAASTYMRGIDFVQIPTSLLAQVDASVGGKVGINFGAVKNLIGSFQQPVAVVIDLSTLKTLPARELHSGIAEIIKHGLIADAMLFDRLSRVSLATATTDELRLVIRRSIEIKAQVVQSDEREQGPRKNLNFGHTIGHAIESLLLDTANPLLHGEAVAIGMIGEAVLSWKAGILERRSLDQIERVIALHGLPTRLPIPIDPTRFIEKIRRDKKNVSGTIRWVLLTAIGAARFDCEVPSESVIETLSYLNHG